MKLLKLDSESKIFENSIMFVLFQLKFMFYSVFMYISYELILKNSFVTFHNVQSVCLLLVEKLLYNNDLINMP